MMYLIGNKAYQYWDRDLPQPILKKWHILCQKEELEKFLIAMDRVISYTKLISENIYELKIINGDLLKFEITPQLILDFIKRICEVESENHHLTYERWTIQVIPEILLYLMKRSEIYWDIDWFQNIEELHYLKHRVSSKILPELGHEFYKTLLIEESKKIHPLIPKKEYCTALREIVKVGIQPAIELTQTDNINFIKKSSFNKLPEIMKIWLIYEEIATIALEEKIIPLIEKINYESFTPNNEKISSAYRWAYRRLCISITTGWFRDYCINSWPYVKDPVEPFFKKYENYKRKQKPSNGYLNGHVDRNNLSEKRFGFSDAGDIFTRRNIMS